MAPSQPGVNVPPSIRTETQSNFEGGYTMSVKITQVD